MKYPCSWRLISSRCLEIHLCDCAVEGWLAILYTEFQLAAVSSPVQTYVGYNWAHFLVCCNGQILWDWYIFTLSYITQWKCSWNGGCEIGYYFYLKIDIFSWCEPFQWCIQYGRLLEQLNLNPTYSEYEIWTSYTYGICYWFEVMWWRSLKVLKISQNITNEGILLHFVIFETAGKLIHKFHAKLWWHEGATLVQIWTKQSHLPGEPLL